MLHELFITHCTNGTSIINPFTFIKENGDVTSTPHEEEFDECNYESVEEQETTGDHFVKFICIHFMYFAMF